MNKFMSVNLIRTKLSIMPSKNSQRHMHMVKCAPTDDWCSIDYWFTISAFETAIIHSYTGYYRKSNA